MYFWLLQTQNPLNAASRLRVGDGEKSFFFYGQARDKQEKMLRKKKTIQGKKTRQNKLRANQKCSTKDGRRGEARQTETDLTHTLQKCVCEGSRRGSLLSLSVSLSLALSC